ncbi:MAG: hypothetical protein H6737_23935 [Alphaproteobacteria bacterium]|nr:hypothetical protein [Alphaproteobacteria bacterium]
MEADATEAIARLGRGDPEGIALADDVLRHAPYHAGLNLAVARHHARSGDLDAALLHASRVLEMEAMSPRALAAALEDVLPDASAAVAGLDARWAGTCRTADLCFDALEPNVDWSGVVLIWPEHAQEAMEAAYLELLAHVGRVNARLFDQEVEDCIDDEQLAIVRLQSPFEPDDRLIASFGGYGWVLKTLEAFAPHVEDVRFFLFDQTSPLDEIWIVDGVFHLVRHPSTGDTADYLAGWLEETGLEDPAVVAHVCDAWFRQAHVALESRSPDRAEPFIQRIRELDGEPWALQAMLEHLQGRPEALESLRAAIVRAPQSRLCARTLLEALFQRDAWAECARVARRVAAFGYQDDALLLAARAHAHLGHREDAAATLLRYVDLRSTSSPGVLLREGLELKDTWGAGAALLLDRLSHHPTWGARAAEARRQCLESWPEPVRRPFSEPDDAWLDWVAHPVEYRASLRVEQVEPVDGICDHQARITVLPGHEAAVTELASRWEHEVAKLFELQPGPPPFFVFEQQTDWYRAGLEKVELALLDLAEHVEDARFLLWEVDRELVDIVTYRDGCFGLRRVELDDSDTDALRRGLVTVAREDPSDDAWRRMTARMHLRSARMERRYRSDRLDAALATAMSLETEDPGLWQLLGEIALERGETGRAERCFREQHTLSGQGLLRAAVSALAAGREDVAREVVGQLLAVGPSLAVWWLAGFLGIREDAASRMLGALDALDTDIAALAENDPRFPELVRWARGRLTTGPEAAEILLAAAVALRDRGDPDAGEAFEAAWRVDPLGGRVDRTHARGLTDPGARRPLLERALEQAPTDAGLLSEVGRVRYETADYAGAVEVLERWRARWHPDRRRYGDALDLLRLAGSLYFQACMALYGRPPGAPRPPGRPTDAALDATDGLLDRALEVVAREPFGATLHVLYVVKATVALFREDPAAAVGWTDRALVSDSAEAWSARASALGNLRQLDAALDAANRAVELAPDAWHPHLVRACILGLQGARADEILAPLERVAELWPEGAPEVLDEPDLASIRKHPRFNELFAPKSDSFP